MRKMELVALLKLSSICLMIISVLWLFLMVAWVGRQCLILIFPYRTNLLFLEYLFLFIDEVNDVSVFQLHIDNLK